MDEAGKRTAEGIVYVLERKAVRNLNLRIHRDGTVYLSAGPEVPEAEADAFVARKSAYIRRAQAHFEEMARYAPSPKQYVSGETFYLRGRGLRLKVEEGPKDCITSDGVYLRVQMKNREDGEARRRLVTRWLPRQCRLIFREAADRVYPQFVRYGVEKPRIHIRSMDTQWGSCVKEKQIITLNRRLAEMPEDCIEYVVTHEFCHLVLPNHSRRFYELLTVMMPDWQERKRILDSRAYF